MSEITKEQTKGYHEDFPTIKTLEETLPAPMVDEADAKTTYYGYAPLGTPTSKALWKIIKVTKTNAASPYGVVTTAYAEGNMDYDNIWDNRAALTYSR